MTKGKIIPDVITLMDKWRHTSFNVYCGQRILPWQKRSMENLAHYIIRASFSQERMIYIQDEAKVVYQSKDGRAEKMFDALEWLAAMCSHVPTKGEQMVRYYGYYSNVSRGRRKKTLTDDQIPYILEPELSPKEFRKNWVRLTIEDAENAYKENKGKG
ncbi:transposase [Thermodesulfobacteriota bacterium]